MINYKIPYVWIIGGGMIQADYVDEYHRRKYNVIVSDRDSNCYCKDIADEVWVIDTRDWVGHIQKALSMRNHPPAAVACVGTDAGPVASYIARVFDLPACSVKGAIDAKDKARMREILSLPHPWYALPFIEDNLSYREDCVVKPPDSMASRGVSIVRSPDEMDDAIKDAWEETWQGSTRIVVEELLDRVSEAATDWFIEDGKVYFINGALRLFDGVIEKGYINPWTPPAEIIELARVTVEKLRIDEGPFKMDLLEDARYGWCLLECATRWSGSFDHSKAAEYSTHRDLKEMYAAYTLGESIDLKYFSSIYRFKYVYVFQPDAPGIIVGDTIMGHYDSYPWSLEVIKTGEKIPVEYNSCADRAMFVMIEGETVEECYKRRDIMDIDWRDRNA